MGKNPGKDPRMPRIPLRLFAALALVALTAFVAACGSSSSSEKSGGKTASTKNGNPNTGKKGGKLTQLGASDVDFLDPGQTYYTGGYQVLYATQKTLYSFKPGDPDAKPDLAASAPQISSDKKTVTVELQKGVKFAPPVNREIQAKDVKYAFERAFSKQVPNQYTTYFNFIKGAPKKPTNGAQDISGIKLDPSDPYKITFELAQAQGVGFAAFLVMPVTVPVPKEYAQKFDKASPSEYNENVVASGPYMVENNAQGKDIGYSAGKSIHLVRNPNWDKSKDFRPAYLDEILLRTNATDANVSGRQVLDGKSMTLDANPPAQVLKRVVLKQKDQLDTVPSGGFRWFPLNMSIKPLDNINVRKAILAAFDRDAARKARGGKFVGPTGTHFIPPGINGFEEAGGLKGFGFDFLANEKGDMAVATKYMKAAGYPSGKYTGKAQLLMVTANVDPGKAQAEVAKAQLEKLGFNIRLRTVPQDAVYTEWCQQPAKKVAVCGSAGWFKDFNDPQSMLEPTFKGSNFSPDGGNNNLAQLKDPKIDAAMDKAALLEGKERYQAWADIDKMITAQAPAVPFVWDNTNLIHSKNVNGVANEYFTAYDFSFTSIK
jgi:peptide/nickel transport system substrate-binding protein